MTSPWISQLLKRKYWPVSRSGRKQYHRPSPNRPRVEALEDRRVPTVSFFGGNLLPHVQAQALFLGHEFSSTPANTETATLDAFLKDITGGPYMQALGRAGFNVGPGTAVAGVTRRLANARAVASTLRERRRGGNEKGSNQQRKWDHRFGHLM